jgi:hypothetical protein
VRFRILNEDGRLTASMTNTTTARLMFQSIGEIATANPPILCSTRNAMSPSGT